MKQFSIVLLVLGPGLAMAQPADPPPADAPDAPPPVEPTPAATEVPPPEVVEPPPPTPPPAPVAGTTPPIRSMLGDQRLHAHSYGFERETPLKYRNFTYNVFGDFWFQSGPRIGASAGIYRAFEAHLGVLLDQYTVTSSGPMPTSTTSRSTRLFYGISMGFFSYAGVEASGGFLFHLGDGDTNQGQLIGELSIALDSHWLPFRVRNTRFRATYPIGIGLEWGAL